MVPFVCEIPAGTRAKMEVNLQSAHNPIVQDKHRNEDLRYWSKAPMFNYGMIPQTYEDPKKKCPIANMFGDADPIDVVDISTIRSMDVGSIAPAKILGSFCLIDEGEADWKIIVSTNPSDNLNNEVLQNIFHFFETYKTDAQNYIHNNRQLFTPTETRDVLHLACTNYNNLIENLQNENGQKTGLWFPQQA